MLVICFFSLLKFRFMYFPKQHVSVVKFESQNNLKKSILKKNYTMDLDGDVIVVRKER